jgi:hypothetical protein
MASMRFNHMELSFPFGTLTQAFRDDVDAFYCGVFGWDALDTEVVGQSCHLLRPDDGQFILLAEGKRPMSSLGYDRLQIKQYDDLVGPSITVHAFYVKQLLPIWFDIQCMEWPAGSEPARRWAYS